MVQTTTLRDAIGTFGKAARAKLTNTAARGAPEDQLRAPLERLIADLAELSQIPKGVIALVGETALAELKTRPDYAVSRGGALIGFIEVKAPGKGADPRRYKGHDKDQWDRIQSLPNLLYTDGNAFSLWRDGVLVGNVVQLLGDIETSGAALDAPESLQSIFEDFFNWQPIPPKTARHLAETAARLCRLLRAEVTEQLTNNNETLADLAKDWRQLLFPEASDAQFADGFAQTVTFGLLVARAFDIPLDKGIHDAAKTLGERSSLIGAALRVLTDSTEQMAGLRTSIGTLVRVLDAVHWSEISRGRPEAWLYFYEEFLAVYDNELRRQTGSYYTPPEVVESMVRLVDEALRTRFGRPQGIAAEDVTVVDPAVGTGTFILALLDTIARSVTADIGAGAVPDAIQAALKRVVAFEMQLGPFAVAQLRVLAAIADLAGSRPQHAPRMFVTDTLSDPFVEETHIPAILKPIAVSRREANKVKQHERITVVIGNPPYKDKAKGKGGWIESGNRNTSVSAPLDRWMPPREWHVGAHTKHLRNLYVYFWRWATWKVFDQDPAHDTGIVCFITAAGFLNGPGFQAMRAYLRATCDEIFVVDGSPEGHQPDVSTRIFQGVQQPVCIVLAIRAKHTDSDSQRAPASVRYLRLPRGPRGEKFAALAKISLDDEEGWKLAAAQERASFFPEGGAGWVDLPLLKELFRYDGSGVMAGRTWVIAPDKESLENRWRALRDAPKEKQVEIFHPHQKGDKHVDKATKHGLPGHPVRQIRVSADKGECIPPVRYGYRTLDRQWIIPDARLINRPNPELWRSHSEKQIYLTALDAHSPSSGPAVSATALIPDLHHYKGSFGGRVFPLYLDHLATVSNLRPGVLDALSKLYARRVGGEELFAYVAAVAANPAYTARFREDLKQPGLRIPISADASLFAEAMELGRRVLWLHSFGERCADPGKSRPGKPPRVTGASGPTIPRGATFQKAEDPMPDLLDYDPVSQRLLVGTGHVANVPQSVWDYTVSGKKVLRQWFSYRRATRERPVLGDRRRPSPLGDIQPDHWPLSYTQDLLDVLHVICLLVGLEPSQKDLLNRICDGPLVTRAFLEAAGAFAMDPSLPRAPSAIPDGRIGDAKGETRHLPGFAPKG